MKETEVLFHINKKKPKNKLMSKIKGFFIKSHQKVALSVATPASGTAAIMMCPRCGANSCAHIIVPLAIFFGIWSFITVALRKFKFTKKLD